MLTGKNIVLGVCGSIAAYKSALLVRLLVKAGANVKVVMTPDAVNFITPLTPQLWLIIIRLIPASGIIMLSLAFGRICLL